LTGKCNFGPHRDDIEFLINNVSVRKYGSSGQQRTFILALKMAELDLLNKTLNVPPILILDDVLAELDLTRQNLLLNSVGKDSQCFISATHLDKFNQSFLSSSLNNAASFFPSIKIIIYLKYHWCKVKLHTHFYKPNQQK